MISCRVNFHNIATSVFFSLIYLTFFESNRLIYLFWFVALLLTLTSVLFVSSFVFLSFFQFHQLFTGTYYYLDKPAPIPNINISLDQIIDPQLIDNVKTISIEKYNNVVNISSDYLLYVKSALQNSANEAKKLWSENFPY